MIRDFNAVRGRCVQSNFEDSGCSAPLTNLFHQAFAMLLRACPNLDSFSCKNNLTSAIFSLLSVECLQLSKLSMLNEEKSMMDVSMRNMLSQLPRLFPKLTVLNLDIWLQTCPTCSSHKSHIGIPDLNNTLRITANSCPPVLSEVQSLYNAWALIFWWFQCQST